MVHTHIFVPFWLGFFSLMTLRPTAAVLLPRFCSLITICRSVSGKIRFGQPSKGRTTAECYMSLLPRLSAIF